MAEKIRIDASKVLARVRGKIVFVDAAGNQSTIKAANAEIVGELPTKETKMADNGNGKRKSKKAKKVSEATGVRTIGGKAVDLTKYIKVKTAAGGTSYNNGDAVAERLQGKSLEEVYTIAAKALKIEEKELYAKYRHLNVGMQRMALGNRMRKGTRAAA